MADCCLDETSEFTTSLQQQQHNLQATYDTHNDQQSAKTEAQPGFTIPQSAPLLYSSFIEQSSQMLLNLCLFQDQVIIAQDRLAKSTLVFDGQVKFGIFQEQNGQDIHSKIIFSKNELSTTFLFLNSAEARLWYMKLLELGIPQLVQITQPTCQQQERLAQLEIVNALLAKEQEIIKSHSRKPSIFKYESMNLPYKCIPTLNKRFQKSSSDISSFFYKLVLTRQMRGNPKQDALVMQQLLL